MERVFLSSTSRDLEEHRKAVLGVLMRSENFPEAMESFGALPGEPVEVCLEKVRRSDALVLIVAHRYGWVPAQNDGGKGNRSITWLETEEAVRCGKPVLAFLIDPDYSWPHGKEQDDLAAAVGDDAKVAKVVQGVAGLRDFKQWIDNEAPVVRDVFTTPENLAAKVATALLNVQRQRPTSRPRRSAELREVHVLQPAQHFTGRELLLNDLREWWLVPEGDAKVHALVGVGGAGKTAVVEQWLRWIRGQPPRGRTLVWCFNDQPDTDAFLREACSCFIATDVSPRDASLERLLRALREGGPHLLVLDGLESVQDVGGHGLLARGELMDPQLRNLLRAIAHGLGMTRALITSRFPLTDLAAWEGTRAFTNLLDKLEEASAVSLLRRWGVRGDDAVLADLARSAGYHALTVSVLGSFLARFNDGDPAGVPELRLVDETVDDPQAARLARVLESYRTRLPADERDLLVRLSAFPRGASLGLLRMAIANPRLAGALHDLDDRQLDRLGRRLLEAGLVFRQDVAGETRWSAHPFVRDWFRVLLGPDEKSLHEAVSSGIVSLVGRPQRTLDDPRHLELYETLIESTIGADRFDEAFQHYMEYFHGIEGLGLQAGDFARGARILAKFSSTGRPEDGAKRLSAGLRGSFLNEWAAFAASVGDLRIAADAMLASLNNIEAGSHGLVVVARNASAIYVHCGRLPEAIAIARRAVEEQPDGRSLSRLGIALHLSGDRTSADEVFARMARSSYFVVDSVAYAALDVGWPSAAFRLCLNLKPERGWMSAQRAALLARAALTSPSARDRTHHTDVPGARENLKRLQEWTVQSGEMRLVVESYWIAAEVARQAGDLQGTVAEIETGLTQARGCGYGLLEIDFLCLRARARMALGEPKGAFEDALEARTASERPECGYAWGLARATRLCADALDVQGKHDDARAERAEADRLMEMLLIVHDATAYQWKGTGSSSAEDALE
jgi:hypothetical protein